MNSEPEQVEDDDCTDEPKLTADEWAAVAEFSAAEQGGDA